MILQIQNKISEEDWKLIYEYIINKRMDQLLYDAWTHSQDVNGEWKYKAIGQLFARYATLRRGFKTLKQTSFYTKSQCDCKPVNNIDEEE